MKRLTLFAVLAASLLAWAAPSFAQMTAGNYWRTAMRYGGRDSAIVAVPGGWDTYYLDIYSQTYLGSRAPGGNGVGVYTTTVDTTITAPWSAIVQFRWTESTTLAEAVATDSSGPVFLPRARTMLSATADTLASGAGIQVGVYPAAGDTVSTAVSLPASGEIQAYFSKYAKNFIVPINAPTGAKAPRLVIRVRPGGTNSTGFNYYYRLALRGSR